MIPAIIKQLGEQGSLDDPVNLPTATTRSLINAEPRLRSVHHPSILCSPIAVSFEQASPKIDPSKQSDCLGRSGSVPVITVFPSSRGTTASGSAVQATHPFAVYRRSPALLARSL